MKIPKILIFCIICLWIESGMCNFYMTSFQISNLLKTEREILKSLYGYVGRQEKRGITIDPSVKKFIDYADQANNASSDTSRPDNSLSVFYHVYRAVEEWNTFAKTVSCDEEVEECPIMTGEDVINVVKRREESIWPTDDDLKYAAQAIINVWLIYDLDIAHVTGGSFGNVTERPLTNDQLYFIANAARDAGMTYEAITWFEYLLNRLDTFDDVTFKESSLYRRLGMSYHEFGMTTKAKEVLKKMLTIDPDDKGVSRDLEYLMSKDNKKEKTEFVRFQSNDQSKVTSIRQSYEELCRTTANGEPHFNRNLSCVLIPLSNCYGNVKVELISKRPRIEIIHDVLSSNETDDVISCADQFLPNPDRVTEQGMMISKQMCEYNKRCPLMRQLTRRLARMTRFEMYQQNRVSSSQCYELINEGSGIISKPDADFWPEGHYPHPYAGNRLATIFMQLTDIQYGGSLIFPRINVTVPLEKGSAAIWWNLRRNGKPSIRSTYHHCPVLQGSQWALVKRVLYTNQVFARNCEK